MTTYGELFDRFLHEAIAAGGEVARVCQLAVSLLRTDPAVRVAVFEDWLAGEQFRCEQCRVAFAARERGIQEDAEVRCDWCRHGGFATNREPVPGYLRTFVR